MNDAYVYDNGSEGNSEELLSKFMAKIDEGAMSDAKMAGFVAREKELNWDDDLEDEEDMEEDGFLDFGKDVDEKDLVGAFTIMTMAERIRKPNMIQAPRHHSN